MKRAAVRGDWPGTISALEDQIVALETGSGW